MARINVEDSIYRDPRFVRLCALVGSMEAALGTLVLAWDSAQRAFWKGKTTIPIEELKTRLSFFEQLVQVGLASVVDEAEVYIAGSEEAFKNLEAVREKRRAAGVKSGEVRRNNREGTQTNKTNTPEQKQAKRTKTNPSTSTSTSIIPFAAQTGVVQSQQSPAERNPVGLWVKAYQEKYGVRYRFQKKDFGMLKHFGEQHGSDEVELLFACYLAISEPLYANAKHPLSLFFRDLQKISVAAQTGIDPSKPKAFDYSKLPD